MTFSSPECTVPEAEEEQALVNSDQILQNKGLLLQVAKAVVPKADERSTEMYVLP